MQFWSDHSDFIVRARKLPGFRWENSCLHPVPHIQYLLLRTSAAYPIPRTFRFSSGAQLSLRGSWDDVGSEVEGLWTYRESPRSDHAYTATSPKEMEVVVSRVWEWFSRRYEKSKWEGEGPNWGSPYVSKGSHPDLLIHWIMWLKVLRFYPYFPLHEWWKYW